MGDHHCVYCISINNEIQQRCETGDVLRFVYNTLPLVYMMEVDPLTQFSIIYIYTNSPPGLFVSLLNVLYIAT